MNKVAAIYVRKSKATEKGDSIQNQEKRCKTMCKLRGWDYKVYEDYDISGKNLDRPSFQQMMKDVEKGSIHTIICYRLDRISRSVSDFSNLIKELESIDIGFISVNESFDLESPMGRAMMMITSVFAQLERETIAERVRDNMIDRAKLGKWNGGPVPFGYNSESKTIENGDKTKKVSKLIINKDESEVIKEIYNLYLMKEGSVRSVTSTLNENGYRTKNNAYWSHNQISRILQNPLYCINDSNAYDYFKSSTEVNIVDIKDDYIGDNGLMYYNKRKQYKNTSRERNQGDWILAIGEHKGIIPGETFTKVQYKLGKNKLKAPRTGQSERSPLVGLVKCGRCGSSMSVFSSPKDSNKRQKGYYHYFRCLTREQKAMVLCDNSNMRADKLEDLVIGHITNLLDNENSLQGILEASNNDIEDKKVPLIAKRNKLQSELDNINNEINNLVESLSKNILPELIIKRKYKELENKKIQIRKDLEITSSELNNNYVETFDLDTIKEHIKDFKNTYEYLELDEKKKLLNSIVKEISIDKNKVKLVLYFLPGIAFQDLDSQSFCLREDKDSYLL